MSHESGLKDPFLRNASAGLELCDVVKGTTSLGDLLYEQATQKSYKTYRLDEYHRYLKQG